MRSISISLSSLISVVLASPSPVFGQLLFSLDDHRGSLTDVAFSPKEDLVATCGWDYRIILWDLKTGKPKTELEGHRGVWYHSIAFSPDGKLLVAGSSWRQHESDEVRTVRMWRVDNAEEVKLAYKETGYVYAVAFSSDGKYFASGNTHGEIRIWDTSSGKVLKLLRMREAMVLALVFGPDNKKIVAGVGGQFVMWDWAQGEQLQTVFIPRANRGEFALFADGKVLVSCFQFAVQFWELPTLKEKQTVKGLHFAVSPDQKLVALAVPSLKGDIQILDMETLKSKAAFQAHQQVVTRIAFSRDGKKLATASADATCKVWDVAMVLEKK